MLAQVLLLLAILGSNRVGQVNSHEEAGSWSCDLQSDIRLRAPFRSGIITLDGRVEDWENIDGFEFSLLPALNPDSDEVYKGETMAVKALHDGNEVFFMLQIGGDYAYSKGESNKCPSVALMFQTGQNASYHRMGGCSEEPDKCSNKTCRGHEVDIMHFSIGNAIPGRLYGGNLIDNSAGNGGDRFGHLVDAYAWNPHCRYLDGLGPSGNDSRAQNDWKGVWWHSSLDIHSGFVEEDSPYSLQGHKGTYYFEFSRPLRTMDCLQQDVQFTIGKTSNASVAFWYPEDGKPWHGSGHYSIGCDWVPMDFLSGSSSNPVDDQQKSPWSAATAFSLLFSVVAFCLSVFVGHRASQSRDVQFTPVNNL